MTDTNYLVSMPSTPFSTPRAFKSVSNGRVYIGAPDTDPSIPVNQIPVYVVNEDGSEVQIAQPIIINAGGFPVYNGQIMKFITKQNFSMAVYDAYGSQQYYWPDLSRLDPDSAINNILANLGSDEEGLGADLVAANAYHTVRDILSRTKTYSDYGKGLPINGYDEAFYALVFADKPEDNDLYLPGKLNIAADLYGTSNNAALLTLLGNNSDSFRAQIVSGNSSVLSGYAMAEDMLIYGGMVGKSAITTNAPTYTVNTITITDGADLSKLKTDSVIKTSDLYWGKVVSIAGNIITVDGWYKLKVAGTPTGASAELNRIDKIYFENLVMWAPSTYTGSKVVGAEWDFMIDKDGLTEKNGWDLVLHSSSSYGMDAGYRVRSAASGLGWNTGLRVEDISYAGLYIANGDSGVNASLGSVVDASSNAVGVRFQGLNSLYSMLWRYNGGTVYPSALTPYGFHMKGGRTSSSAVSGTSVTLDYSSYYVNNNTAAFSLVLPSTNLVAGQEIEFYIFGTNEVTVTCSSGSVNVNGASSYSFTPTKTYTRAVARWNGSSWYFFA